MHTAASFSSIFCLLVHLATITVRAQSPDTARTRALSVGTGGAVGFIIPHDPDIATLADATPAGVHLEAFYTFGRDRQCRCFPRLGLTATYYDFGNRDVLGEALSLLAFVAPTTRRPDRPWYLTFRGGFGVAYLTRVYDPVENPENLFFSTALSFLLQAGAAVHYAWSPRWETWVGGRYNHISNGGQRDPNKGINYPMLSAGVAYTPHPVRFVSAPPGAAGPLSPLRYLRAALIGSAQTVGNASRRYPLGGLAATYGHRLGQRNNYLTGGTEWIADGALREYLRQRGRDDSFHRVAALVGHDWRIGRFSFEQQLGVYLYNPAQSRDPVYQRYSLSLSFARRWLVGGSLKAHRQVADFFDLRVAYQWQPTKNANRPGAVGIGQGR